MKLEDIQNEWDKDSKIDHTNLGSEALNSSQLHAKYYKIFIRERMSLRKQEADIAELKQYRFQFYEGKLDDETLRELGWEEEYRAFQLKVLKSEIPRYLESDKILIEANLKLGLQEEKVKFLESIISTINFRNNSIRTAVDWAKFINGG